MDSGRTEYLSAGEAADILGISVITLRARLEAGEIPARKLRRRWIISRRLLEAWATSGNQPEASTNGQMPHSQG